MIEARIRMGVEAGYRGVVASGHLAVLAIELAAKLDGVEASGEPAAYRLIDPGEGGNPVGDAVGGFAIGFALASPSG